MTEFRSARVAISARTIDHIIALENGFRSARVAISARTDDRGNTWTSAFRSARVAISARTLRISRDSRTCSGRPAWRSLLEPGLKRAFAATSSGRPAWRSLLEHARM